VRYQLLIPHIPHRHAKLVELLDVLAAQMRPEVEVLVYTDNLDVSYAEKCQTLADASTADYTSHLANDDSVAPNFIPRILEALEQEPDYVGFRVRYTEAGVLQQPVIHSLDCGGWFDEPQLLRRDLMYYNPIRRALAQQVTFRGPFCDIEWADDLRALGIVKREVFIDEELHYYRRDSSDNFHTHREPMPVDEIPELPAYPFVRHIEYAEVAA
jgi:hypothetical protein